MDFFKRFALALLITIFTLPLFGEVFSTQQITNDSQLLKENHWIYKELNILLTEARTTAFVDTAPLSVGELKFYLKSINYENLSTNGQNLYDKIYSYLYNQPNAITRYSFGLKINPELYARTNQNIESSVRYYYQDWALTLPIIIGISDYFTLETDFFLGNVYRESIKPKTITNIPLNANSVETDFPKYTYGNAGIYFENWGITGTVGKEGFSIGDTQLGSIIYNSTFETEAYSVLSAYTQKFKYNMIFSQVEYDKFLYLHNLNFKLFPNLKISITEGGLRNGPIELKFFNPIMLVHQYFPAKIYERDLDDKYDLDNQYCAYFGITVDYYPIKNLRLYGLWAQTENQGKEELKSTYGQLLPNGYALQIGADYIHPSNKGGYYLANIEGLYTSPFMYIKQSPDWSLIRYRFDLNNQKKDVASWIGTPFGPDTIALTSSFGYQQPGKWGAKLSYLLVMKGEIDADTLITVKATPKNDPDDTTEYPAYYPAVSYYLGKETAEAAIDRARNMNLTGTVQITNRITASGEYYFTDKIKLTGEGSYIFVFNNQHKKNNFQQGLELKLALSYNLL